MTVTVSPSTFENAPPGFGQLVASRATETARWVLVEHRGCGGRVVAGVCGRCGQTPPVEELFQHRPREPRPGSVVDRFKLARSVLRDLTDEQRESFRWEGFIELPSGERGYLMTRPDQCFQCAVATVLQVDMDEVPDARVDERVAAGEDPDRLDRAKWREMVEWVDGRGFTLTVHERAPVARRRWIGVITMPGLFNSHTLVMGRDRVLFDPSAAISSARARLAQLETCSVTYALTLDRRS